MSGHQDDAREAQWSDPREEIEISVLMANGRLAPRRFASKEDAHAWAHEEEGERVVEINAICDCDL
ncbi:hypothetical protein [Demequina muriae]|uniref:Uncharacterized protein n=1 Tax=Demequina muriae TaxID=3051664 RepID=A0ABT8GIN5_9MICO|nr:hypothetical protein [Demequina sp. EGI L300058]MDN4481289.1 hypothetical protein [Demequina sp. EGI L300058]